MTLQTSTSDKQKGKEMDKLCAKLMNKEECNSTTIPTEKLNNLREAIADCKKLKEGQNIQAAEEKSIILLVKFETYAGVATLLEDYIKGDLTEHFKPLQDAIRGIPSYEDYTINVYISNETMFSLLNSLVAGLLLRKSVQRTASVTDSSMPVHDATLDHTRDVSASQVLTISYTCAETVKWRHVGSAPEMQSPNCAGINLESNYEQQFVGLRKQIFCTGLSFVTTNHLVIVYNVKSYDAQYAGMASPEWLNSLSLLKVSSSESVKLLHTIKMKPCPFDVSIFANDTIAITLPEERKIRFFKLYNEKLLRAKRNDISMKGKCWGIAEKNKQILVATSEPSTITLLDMEGGILKSFLTTGLDKTHLLYSMNKNIIYFWNERQKQISVLSLDGRVKTVLWGAPFGISHAILDGQDQMCVSCMNRQYLLNTETGRAEWIGNMFLERMAYDRKERKLFSVKSDFGLTILLSQPMLFIEAK